MLHVFCVFFRIKWAARSGSYRWLSVTVSVALCSLQGIISHLSAVGLSLLRTNKKLYSSDAGAIGPVRNLCTSMLITHLFPSQPPPPQQQHMETWERPAACVNMDVYLLRVFFWFAPLIVFLNAETFFEKRKNIQSWLLTGHTEGNPFQCHFYCGASCQRSWVP